MVENQIHSKAIVKYIVRKREEREKRKERCVSLSLPTPVVTNNILGTRPIKRPSLNKLFKLLDVERCNELRIRQRHSNTLRYSNGVNRQHGVT